MPFFWQCFKKSACAIETFCIYPCLRIATLLLRRPRLIQIQFLENNSKNTKCYHPFQRNRQNINIRKDKKVSSDAEPQMIARWLAKSSNGLIVKTKLPWPSCESWCHAQINPWKKDLPVLTLEQGNVVMFGTDLKAAEVVSIFQLSSL